jgi:hypothetical protein
MAASKKGMSAFQLSRMLGITHKWTWFMSHRIREDMTPTSNSLVMWVHSENCSEKGNANLTSAEAAKVCNRSTIGDFAMN